MVLCFFLREVFHFVCLAFSFWSKPHLFRNSTFAQPFIEQQSNSSITAPCSLAPASLIPFIWVGGRTIKHNSTPLSYTSKMNVILALDIGSSSVRCTACRIEDEATVTAIPNCSTSKPMTWIQPTTGKILLQKGDNDGNGNTLLDDVDGCVDYTLQALRHQQQEIPFQIVGVGISSFVMNLIGIDQRGDLVGDEATISYACHSPAVIQECSFLRSDLGPHGVDRLYHETGTPIHSSYALPQLRQFYKTTVQHSHASDLPFSSVRSKIDRWQTIASLVLSRWTGRIGLPISLSEASWTGLLNVRDGTYNPTVLQLLPEDCQRALPSLADYTNTLDGIPEFIPQNRNNNPQEQQQQSNGKNKYWVQWPELRTCPFFLGIGDGACANIGSKCSTASRIAVTIGTSAAARICFRHELGSTSELMIPKGLFCYRVDRWHVLMGGALTDGGSVIEWIRRVLNLSTDDTFQKCLDDVQRLMDSDYDAAASAAASAVAATRGGKDGNDDGDHSSSDLPLITTIPFFSGERSTGFRDGATGAMIGLTLDTTSAHLIKSCLEGITLRLSAILQLLVEARRNNRNGDDDESHQYDDDKPIILVSGKGLERNMLWRQMIADSSGLSVILDDDTSEGTSRGVARLVAIALACKQSRITETSTLLDEEDIRSCQTSQPRPPAHAYFKHAAKLQDKFLDAMSPLFSSTNET